MFCLLIIAIYQTAFKLQDILILYKIINEQTHIQTAFVPQALKHVLKLKSSWNSIMCWTFVYINWLRNEGPKTICSAHNFHSSDIILNGKVMSKL